MTKVSIPRLYDFQLMEIYLNILTGESSPLPLDIEEINFQLGDHVAINLSPHGLNEQVAKYKDFIDHLASAHSHALLKITIIPRGRGYYISYARADAGLLDHIEVTAPNSFGIQNFGLRDVVALSKLQEMLLLKSANQSHLITDTPEIISARNEVLSQLQKHAADVIRDQLEYRRKLDTEKENTISIEKQRTEARLEELSNDYKLQSKQLEEKYRALDEQITAREQAINDADNTTTRRNTTAAVLEDVKSKAESFSFSFTVAKGRASVVMLSAVMALFGIVNILLGTDHFTPILSNSPRELGSQALSEYTAWLAFAKIFGGSFVFISSLIYLIRYQSQWTNKAANVELDYQKFSRDLNRAHLAIEMCLEWNEKKEGPIPETLLNAMTNSLFNEAQNKNEEILHPAEQLAAAMLRSAERIEFPLGSGKITTKGKDIPKSLPSTK